MAQFGLRIRAFESHSHFPSIGKPPRSPNHSKIPQNRTVLDLHTVTPHGEIPLPGQMGSRHVAVATKGSRVAGLLRPAIPAMRSIRLRHRISTGGQPGLAGSAVRARLAKWLCRMEPPPCGSHMGPSGVRLVRGRILRADLGGPTKSEIV